MQSGHRGRYFDHLYAVNGARCHTQFTAGAVCGDDRMHEIRRADNGVYRTCRQAQCAADARALVDDSEQRFGEIGWCAPVGIVYQLSEGFMGFAAAGRAKIQWGAGHHCFGVGTTAGVTALSALSLR